MKSKLKDYMTLGAGFLGAVMAGLLVYKLIFAPKSKEAVDKSTHTKTSPSKPEKESSQKPDEDKKEEKKEERQEEKKDEPPPTQEELKKEESQNSDEPPKTEKPKDAPSSSPSPVSSSSSDRSDADAHQGGRSDKKETTPPSEGTTSTATTKEDKEVTSPPPLLRDSPKDQGLSIIITGLGVDDAITTKAIMELPENVALAFSPYSKMVNRWIEPARTRGHIILIELPSENDINLQGVMIYFDGFFFFPGKNPTKDPKKLQDILQTCKNKKKIIVDGRLLAENFLAKEAHKKSFEDFFFVDYTIIPENIVMDKQDPFLKRGIVTITADLVPYLIKHLKKGMCEIKPLMNEKKREPHKKS